MMVQPVALAMCRMSSPRNQSAAAELSHRKVSRSDYAPPRKPRSLMLGEGTPMTRPEPHSPPSLEAHSRFSHARLTVHRLLLRPVILRTCQKMLTHRMAALQHLAWQSAAMMTHLYIPRTIV